MPLNIPLKSLNLIFQAIIRRKVLFLSLAVLLVTLPILYLVIKYKSPIQAAWGDDSYKSDCAFSGRGTSGFFVEGNPHQKKSNNNKSGKNHYVGVYSPKFTHFSNSPSILTANSKNMLPIIKLNVKYKNSLIVLGVEMVIPAKAVIKAAAEKLINNPEKALNQALEKNPVIKNNLTNKNFFVNEV